MCPSVEFESCASCTLQSVFKRSDILDSLTNVRPALCFDFVAVIAENTEKVIPYKQVVANGGRTLTTFFRTVVDTPGPGHMLSRKTTVNTVELQAQSPLRRNFSYV